MEKFIIHKELTFDELTVCCGFGHFGCEDGVWKWTCRHKNNVPKGSSWGDCSRRLCPLIPQKGINFKIFDKDGNIVLQADSVLINTNRKGGS